MPWCFHRARTSMLRRHYGTTQAIATNRPSLAYYNTDNNIFSICEPCTGSFVRRPIATAKVLGTPACQPCNGRIRTCAHGESSKTQNILYFVWTTILIKYKYVCHQFPASSWLPQIKWHHQMCRPLEAFPAQTLASNQPYGSRFFRQMRAEAIHTSRFAHTNTHIFGTKYIVSYQRECISCSMHTQ